MQPKLAFISRGGTLYIGIESSDVAQPGLQHPAIVQMVSLPAPGSLAGQVGINTISLPVLLPVAWLPLQDGEQLIPHGPDDASWPPAQEFVPLYLNLLDRAKQVQQQSGRRIFSR